MRQQQLTVHGFIYGSVGAKVVLSICPKRKLPFAFIGDPPPEYQKLKKLAERGEEARSFIGVADGYMVENSPGELSLLILSLDNVHEDPTVVSAYRTTRK
jgi:hypothetical protein